MWRRRRRAASILGALDNLIQRNAPIDREALCHLGCEQLLVGGLLPPRRRRGLRARRRVAKGRRPR